MYCFAPMISKSLNIFPKPWHHYQINKSVASNMKFIVSSAPPPLHLRLFLLTLYTIHIYYMYIIYHKWIIGCGLDKFTPTTASFIHLTEIQFTNTMDLGKVLWNGRYVKSFLWLPSFQSLFILFYKYIQKLGPTILRCCIECR